MGGAISLIEGLLHHSMFNVENLEERKKVCKMFGAFRISLYLCNDKSRPLLVRSAYPAGHFFYTYMKYTKQAITIEQQIQVLRDRGLVIPDNQEASEILERISYFRLAEYWRHLEESHVSHTFKENSQFSDIISLYYFDKELKTLLFSAIQTIEVTMRSKMIKHFTAKFGPFWFMDETLCVNKEHFNSNLTHIRIEIQRSREEFIKEHFRKYSYPDLPPVWKTLEVVSFGTLSKLFSNFADATVKHAVARDMGLNHYKFIKSWMESLSAIRNYCAHHARVCNRAFPVKPQTPKRMPNNWIIDFSFKPETLYPQLCCISYWMNGICKNNFTGDFKALLSKYPSVNPDVMGFPNNWEMEPLWK